MGSRREFLKKSTAGAVGISLGGLLTPNVSLANGILGSNDRVNVAVVGLRGRAKPLINAISKYPNAKITYICDVDDKIIGKSEKLCQQTLGYIPKIEKDFRNLVEKRKVDAVFIATPEHWHAPMAILALKAGKHVYVEKPCSHNLFENELLVKAQKKYGKVVQMGNQQRSSITSKLAVEEIKQGIIGEVYKGEAYYNNNRGSIGIGKKVAIPSTLDWDLWQGPAPRQEYTDNVHPYNWHWFKKWGTGEIHNNGTHEIDICRWALGVDIPKTVSSVGGKYTYKDDWEFTDNQLATFTYDNNKFITWTGHSRGRIMPKQPGRGLTIYGSKGSIMLSRNGYNLCDLEGKIIKREKEQGKNVTLGTTGGGSLDIKHVANFFNAIRINEAQNSPIADASITTMTCHLGNIAQELGKTLHIDPKTGKVTNDDRADNFWKREYEKGWEPTL